jgi:hypothetical protein
MTTQSTLLALHDAQVRGSIADRLPKSWRPSWDGPVLQIATPGRGLAFAQDLDGLSGAELDALIGRVRDRAALLGQAVEWKTYGHDRRDLTERLRLAGFAPRGRGDSRHRYGGRPDHRRRGPRGHHHPSDNRPGLHAVTTTTPWVWSPDI